MLVFIGFFVFLWLLDLLSQQHPITRQLLEHSQKDPEGHNALFYTESEVADQAVEALHTKD